MGGHVTLLDQQDGCEQNYRLPPLEGRLGQSTCHPCRLWKEQQFGLCDDNEVVRPIKLISSKEQEPGSTVAQAVQELRESSSVQPSEKQESKRGWQGCRAEEECAAGETAPEHQQVGPQYEGSRDWWLQYSRLIDQMVCYYHQLSALGVGLSLEFY